MGLFMRAVEEMLRLEPFALKPPLHIAKGGDDGVDFTQLDGAF